MTDRYGEGEEPEQSQRTVQYVLVVTEHARAGEGSETDGGGYGGVSVCLTAPLLVSARMRQVQVQTGCGLHVGGTCRLTSENGVSERELELVLAGMVDAGWVQGPSTSSDPCRLWRGAACVVMAVGEDWKGHHDMIVIWDDGVDGEESDGRGGRRLFLLVARSSSSTRSQ